MKVIVPFILFQLLAITSFSQGFEVYRIYDFLTFSGGDISGTAFDTTANVDGSVVTVRFGLVNKTGELQRLRIERARIVHAEGTQDNYGYAASGGSITFSMGDVSAVDLYTPDVDLTSYFVNDGDSLRLTCFYDIGEINECSYFRYYVIDDFDVRLDSIDVNFCQFGLSLEETFDLPITVYPNPTADFIQLNYPAELNSNSTVQLKDLNGKTLLSVKLEPILDLSAFANGMYVLTIIDEEQNQVYKEKLIIE